MIRRPLFLRSLPLALAVALPLSSCSMLGKKDAAKPDAAAEAKPDEKKEAEAEKEKEKEEKPVDPKKAAAEARKQALAAEEFKGLPRGEAEFILAAREAAATGPSIASKEGVVLSTADVRDAAGSRPEQRARLQAAAAGISAYAAKLKGAGVEFVFAPVPPKAFVYPDAVSGAEKIKARRYDSQLQAFYAELRKAGVTVVDVTDDLIDDRYAKKGGSFPKKDARWSPLAATTAAEDIRKAVKRSPLLKELAPDKAIVSQAAVVAGAEENFSTRVVGTKEGDTLKPLPQPKKGEAPILLVGDGNATVFHTANQPAGFRTQPGAGLPEQLAAEFAAPVEVRAESSVGWKDAVAEFAPGKKNPKLVVWAFSAGEILKDPKASAPAAVPAAKPVRRSSRPSVPTPSGSGLQLREDPGLEMRE